MTSRIMKLADESFKLQSTEVAGFHTRALRVIGQDLADLFPEILEIERQGENFIVRGQCARSRLESKAPFNWNYPGFAAMRSLSCTWKWMERASPS